MEKLNKSGLPERNHTRLLIIDLQEKLMPVIHERQKLSDKVNTLIKGMEILKVPTVVTEQYPAGLGKTDAAIHLPEDFHCYEKICFSGIKSQPVLEHLKAEKITDLVICGVEAHICVLQTALDAIDWGFRVHVVADAVSSRFLQNKELALERMRQSGVYITSVEMILFLMMKEAGNPEFKAISKLIR
jgi:nicotinamidase-related amidase